MRPVVRDAFVTFSAPLEGVCGWMYLDVRGLVTTAIGVLIDPVALALPLPWRRVDDVPATPREIEDEWKAVKVRTDLALYGGGSFKRHTSLHLTEEDIEFVTMRKLAQMWTHLVGRLPAAAEWPCDAQLALLSHAWAVGPAFQWPMLLAALRASDFALAATECTIRGGGTIVERNRRNRILWRNAAIVQKHGMNPDVLHWPKALDDTEITEPVASVPPSSVERATRPWGGEIGDDIAQATLEEIEKRHSDE